VRVRLGEGNLPCSQLDSCAGAKRRRSTDRLVGRAQGLLPCAFLDNSRSAAIIRILRIAEAAVLITLQELERHRIEVSKAYAPGALDYRGADFEQVCPLQVEAVAELEGSEIRIRGHLGTRLRAPCDRCLGPVDISVERDFDLFYRSLKTIAREEEIETPADELEVGFYSGDGIALADVVTEQVILALPMKVVCRPECLGLCPTCGADRNREACGCAEPREDSPFASLEGEWGGGPWRRA
jgi:uncharacterized protein